MKREANDAGFSLAVLTVSDRCAAGLREDTAGPAVVALAECGLGLRCIATACVADGIDSVGRALREWLNFEPPPDLILTVGGSGFGPRDHTPEATAPLIDRSAAPLLELARQRALPDTPHAYLSRGIAGIAGRTLIVNLPGSQRGATQTLGHLQDVLPHAIAVLNNPDAPHPCCAEDESAEPPAS
jgi:molybdenum cofactor synthesis domain-containing protein